MKHNEKVIIIGGSSGIGLAAAKAAAEQGYQVIIASRSPSKLARALATIDHPNASAETLDLLDSKSIEWFFNKTGKFDHLVVTGSEIHFGAFSELPLAAAKQSFESKFWGAYQTVHAALPYINTGGSIILFSGSAGQRPENGSELMTAINSAVEGLGRALAISLAPIRVNVIAPGLVDTPAYADFDDASRQAMFAGFSKKLLVQRPAKAEEIAQSVLYLLQSTYTTGTVLLVDGGHAAH